MAVIRERFYLRFETFAPVLSLALVFLLHFNISLLLHTARLVVDNQSSSCVPHQTTVRCNAYRPSFLAELRSHIAYARVFADVVTVRSLAPSHHLHPSGAARRALLRELRRAAHRVRRRDERVERHGS